MIKEVRNNLYVHISNIDALKHYLTAFQFEQLQANLSNVLSEYQILKYDTSSGEFSVIVSPDWDTANEPTVGPSIRYGRDGTIRSSRAGGTQVYHNKWQFVARNYTGFDVEESIRRTSMLKSRLDLSSVRNQIGNRAFWINLLQQHNISL